MNFKELGLAEPIVRAVAAEGYVNPTTIQRETIPAILAGRDLLGCAQTGTGKTGAYALPILHRLCQGDNRHTRGRRSPRALVLCPTRELAAQVNDSFAAYGRFMSLQSTIIYGGVSQRDQTRRLRAGVDIIVATPGRLLDLMNQGYVDLRSIEMVVLDEADRMLDMGFVRDIQQISQELPKCRQTLMFSATMPRAIRQLAASMLKNHVSAQAAPASSVAQSISQSVYFVAKGKKRILLERLLRQNEMQRTLIFTRTKRGADKLAIGLQRSGFEADAIHGNKSQAARTRTLGRFKSGRMPVLVATDVASRGIDVSHITHVINYDLPNDAETYIHRVGRTARAGATGVALSFCDHDEVEDLRAIEQLLKTSLDVRKHEHHDLTTISHNSDARPVPQDSRRPMKGRAPSHASQRENRGTTRQKRRRSSAGRTNRLQSA